jgi:uncharacterized protein YfdQ (DUF2303 family)
MTSKPNTPAPDESGSALLIDKETVLERIITLGRESRGVLHLDLEPPENSVGLPGKVPALIKFGPTPEIVSIHGLLENYRTAPERRAGAAKVTTLQSFIDLVNRHRDKDSAIFAKTDWPAPRLLAVIDYHTTDHEARFGRHRIEYTFPLTDEFKIWMEFNGKLIEQGDFALFLEEHAAELAAPFDAEKTEYERLFKERFAAPHEVINLSRSLEIYVGQKIKRQERLQTGERTVLFEATHTGANGEAVDIPGIFMVSVAAFIDGDPIRIPARLRYRVSSGEIKWGYQLYRPEHWLRTKVKEDLDAAAEATTLPAFEGAPES